MKYIVPSSKTGFCEDGKGLNQDLSSKKGLCEDGKGLDQDSSSKTGFCEDGKGLNQDLSSKTGLREDGVRGIYCGRQGMGCGRRSRPWLRERRGARREAVGGITPQVRTGSGPYPDALNGPPDTSFFSCCLRLVTNTAPFKSQVAATRQTSARLLMKTSSVNSSGSWSYCL